MRILNIIFLIVFAAFLSAAKINSDTLIIGKDTNNHVLRVNSGKLQFANDGINFTDLGEITGLVTKTANVINNGSSCSVFANNGLVNTTGRSGTGRCTIVFDTTAFSGTPICNCTTYNNLSAMCSVDSGITYDPTQIGFITASSSGSLFDGINYIICVGNPAI